MRQTLSSIRALFRDRRGAASSEYVITVGVVGLLVVGAFLVAGPQLAADFVRTQKIIASPFP
jgi:Flp pilus assembly pilin Flp